MASTRKNIDIEILRVVGVLFVLFAHSHGLFPWPTSYTAAVAPIFDTWTGVDLFFCVSGYIITRSVLREFERTGGQGNFLNFAVPFWIRRAWRLWPTAWVWLTFLLVASIVFRDSGYFGRFSNNLLYQIYSMLHLANFYGFYCKWSHTCGINQVYWSLSTEEQFYFLFPIVLFLVPRKYWIYAFLAVFAVQFPMNRGGDLAGFLRCDAIALGVVITLLQNRREYRRLEPVFLANKAVALCVFAMLTLTLGALGAAEITLVPFSTGIVAVVSGLMVFIASFDKGYLVPFRWLHGIVEYLGSRTYTIYVVHIPAFLTAKEVWRHILPAGTHVDSTYTLRFGLMGLGLLIAFTELNYHLIENPLRHYGARVAANFRKESDRLKVETERERRETVAV